MSKTELTPIDNKERFIISQSNDLVEANYSTELTAQAHKIARLIFSLISPNDRDLRTYTISLDALKQYLGMNSNIKWGSFYDRLKETTQKLNKQPIEIKEPNGEYLVGYLISSYKISPEKGTVTFEVSGLLKPYLLELKRNYTSYPLRYIPNLRSSYSIRVYELLHQYRRIGKRSFEVANLQKKVGSNYKLYGDFKRYVILQAQKDVKKHTDLAFVFNEIKTGRKVTDIEFIIFGNKPENKKSTQLSFLEDAVEIENKNIEEKPAFSEKLIEVLNKLGISEQNIAKYLAKGFEIIQDNNKRKEIIKRCDTLENYYLEKLELLKNSSSAQANNNSAGFLVQALKEDWTNSTNLKKQKEKVYANELSKAKKQYQTITKNIEALDKKRKSLEATTIKELINNRELLERAYNDSISGLGDFMKQHIISSDGSNIFSLPIETQYEKSFQIRLYTNIKLRELHPNHFAEITKMESKKAKLEGEADQLKKKYYL
ncbi:MAG: replication initiation protein [Saprospiraceae bacterium]